MSNFTAETMELMKGALNSAQSTGDLNKAVTIATGLTWYDLQAPAKNLYPVITPLRNSLPRVARPTPGDAAHWKSIFAINGSGYNSMGWVPEGQRSGVMNYQAVDVTATYVTLGEEDNLTFEAEAAARGLEDENAKVTLRLLHKMMLKEEIALLGGNRTLALGTPTAPTLSTAAGAGTITAASYNVAVVALTVEGYNNSTVAAGVATTQTITGADGQTYTIKGGSSNKSSTTSITLGATGDIKASTPIVNGAVAYAWFAGASGSERLQAITTINSVQITSLQTTTQLLSAITADNSNNATLAFNGLLTTTFAAAASSNAIVYSLATGTAGTGSTLTASGRGSVDEIDNILEQMWTQYKMSPTVMWVNAQELKNITKKVLSNTSGPLLRFDKGANDSNGYELTANGRISYYYNPYSVDGGNKIPVRIHPNCPPGTILLYAERLPEYYQSNATPNVAEVLTRRDYYRMDWPLRTRRREYGVYAEEVLAVYAPFALAVLNNIANG